MAALYAAWIALYALMAVSTWVVEMILQWSEVDVQCDGVHNSPRCTRGVYFELHCMLTFYGVHHLFTINWHVRALLYEDCSAMPLLYKGLHLAYACVARVAICAV